MSNTSKVDRVLLPSAVTPSHYSLSITPDLEKLEFACEEEILVVVSETTDKVVLHTKEISVLSASFQSAETGAENPTLVEISYHLVDTTVTFRFSSSLPLGQGTLKISFRGILNSDMAGFYKSSYADAEGNKKVMASTQFEALDARRAFPCWDEPAVKATFSVTLTVPSALTAISNMPETSVTNLPGGKKRVSFDTSPKMSTYLLAWAVGEFDVVRAVTKHGVKINIYSPPGRAEQGKFALDVGVRALDFYDDFFNVPYPLPKLDMLCVTEFAMGAMENWGLVTYRESALMIDPVKASVQQRQRVAEVVAHELAHQWFGNLVTMQWWSDLWLNEGFASWMADFCTDELFPSWGVWDQYVTDTMGAALRLDSMKSSHPIQVPIRRAEEVEQVFDAISYCKGSTVVRMASCILGKEKFREGLRLYMSRHQYGNTETTDLWQAWSEVSGIDMGSIMNSWTGQMGYPYLKVLKEDWSTDKLDLTLEQGWFLADGSSPSSEEEAGKLWTVPLLFATSSSLSDTAALMTEKVQSFTVPLSGSGSGKEEDWVKINAGQQALVRVSCSSEITRRLQGAIRTGALPAADRAAVLLDAYALAKAGQGSVEGVVDLLRAFDREANSTVWSAIAGVLQGLQLMMEEVGGECAQAFFTFAGKIVKSALESVGWDARPEDGHQEKLLRSTVIGLLDSFCWSDPAIAAEARRRFDAHWAEPDAISSDYKTTLYKIILKNGGTEEYDAILKTFYATEDNNERKFAMFSLGASQSTALKLKTLDWAVKSGDIKLQDFFYPMGAVASSATGAALTWDYYKENFEYIKSKLAKASPSLMDAAIVNSVGRFCTAARASEIEQFFAEHPLPSSARKISQVVENIRTNGSMLTRIQSSKLTDPGYWA